MIGEIVTVTVDRPMGSRHPDYPDTVYPINYGPNGTSFSRDEIVRQTYFIEQYFRSSLILD